MLDVESAALILSRVVDANERSKRWRKGGAIGEEKVVKDVPKMQILGI